MINGSTDLRVVDDWAERLEGAVPVLGGERLEVAVVLQIENDPGDLVGEVRALLHGHRVRLLRKRLTHLGQVAVVVRSVLDLKPSMQC